MAAEPKSDKKSEEMVKSTKADPSSKMSDLNPSLKDGVSDATSCISSVDAGGSIKEGELDHDSTEQSIYYPPGSYYGYYYPGVDGSYVDCNDPSYLVQGSGLEAQQPVMQSDGRQVMYYAPGFPPGYNPYAAIVPGAMVGVDGQYAYQQPYVLGTVIAQSQGSPSYVASPVGYGGPELVPAYSWDSSFWDGYGVNSFDSTLTATMPKTKPNSKMQPSKNSNQNPKLNMPTERKGQSPVLELPPGIEVVNQPGKPVSKSANLPKSYFPAAKVPSFGPQGTSGIIYRANPANAKETGRNWFEPDKVRVRNKSNIGNFDMLSEQNRGPRTDNSKSMWTSVAGQTAPPAGGADDKTGSKTVVIKRDDYNVSDFPTKYDHASFFVIKSYSEDDIHKSIKYNVWASTPNGNRRLDAAYQAAQEKMSEKGSKCPIFLFFSVNASGQFCGVAEMIGRVDFNKNMDFWQQDKWNGFFPVKWHIIKDVPNPQFRHIILENNDNKPVTNSRDTQEVRFPQGIEMLGIFKSFSSRTSILDDFGFYENRQKVMVEKRGRMSSPISQQLPAKVDEVAITARPDDAVPIISSLETLDLGSAKADSGAKTSEVPAAVEVGE